MSPHGFPACIHPRSLTTRCNRYDVTRVTLVGSLTLENDMKDFIRPWGADPYNSANAMAHINASGKQLRSMAFRRSSNRELSPVELNRRNDIESGIFMAGLICLTLIVLGLVIASFVITFL
jgi:hypothetical protein